MMRCVITGLGGRGLHWIRQIRSHPDCRVVGYVEPSAVTRQQAVEQHALPGDHIYPTLDEALRNVEADFVLDVTPPAVHAEIAKRTFAAGLHLLGEKPLSDDFRTAVQVAEWGTQAGRKHMITQNYRFTAFPRTTRRELAQGLIGKPGQCDVRFYMPWADRPGSHYVPEPYMLLNDMMVHHFDLMRYVLGQDPVSVQAMTWNQPWGWHAGDAAHAIVFRYADGLVATHVSVGCAVGSQTSWNGDWRIEGPEGSIDWDKDRMWHHHLHRTPDKLRRELFPLAVPPPEQAILDEFFAAIRDDREPECSARDNLGSLAMVFAAIRSAQESRPVDLAELHES
jgi:predicted dehydrogenase